MISTLQLVILVYWFPKRIFWCIMYNSNKKFEFVILLSRIMTTHDGVIRWGQDDIVLIRVSNTRYDHYYRTTSSLKSVGVRNERRTGGEKCKTKRSPVPSLQIPYRRVRGTASPVLRIRSLLRLGRIYVLCLFTVHNNNIYVVGIRIYAFGKRSDTAA